MDEQRALLDQLMGRERNVPLSQRTGRGRHFNDDDVCKFFLAGLCPYVLFSNTKSDLGDHPNREEDNEDLKAAYDALPEAEKSRYTYDRDLMAFLEDLVSGCDRKVERNRVRVDAENADAGIDNAKVQQLVEIDKQIREKTAESEKVAEEGEVDEAQQLLTQVEALRREKAMIEKSATSKSAKRNVVCEVSGNIMSSSDNEERIRCHFEGKQYLGWKACREKLEDLRKKLSVPSASGGNSAAHSNGYSRDRSGRSNGDSGGGVGGHYGADRSRPRGGSRSRSRSRGRDGRSDRSRYSERPRDDDRYRDDRYRDDRYGGGDRYGGDRGGGRDGDRDRRRRSRSRDRDRDRRDSRERSYRR